MLFGEIVALRAFEIEDAHHAFLIDQRHGQLGARVGVGHDVARVEIHVGHQNGLAGLSCRAHDALRAGVIHLAVLAAPVLDVHRMGKDFASIVVKQNAEHLVVDYALDEAGGAAQQLLDVENGAGFARHFVEHQQRIRLATRAFEQPRVLDGAGQAPGNERKDVLLVGGKVVELVALNVKHADALPLENDGNGELRAHAVERVDVARILADVGHAHRLARLSGRARDSAS